MTIILLASVSLLFALVVTSRPILSDSDLSDFAPTPQTAVQAAFQIHSGEDDTKLVATFFKPQSPKEQIQYLSGLDAENIAVIAPVKTLPAVKPSFEALLDEAADRQDGFGISDELNGPQADHITVVSIASEPVVDNQRETPTNEIPTTPFVVLAFSCVAAFLALACIALTLYITKSLRSQMLASKRVWDLLQGDTSVIVKDHLLGGACLLLQTEIEQRRLYVEEEPAQRHDLRMEDKPLYFDAVSDTESEWDDVEEKYQDALDMTPLPLTHNLPPEEHAPLLSHSGNPPLPCLCPYPHDQLTNDRSTPLIRELCSPRPAWSVRAIDSPALGLSSREGSGNSSTPQPLIHPRRPTYHAAVPQFDIALAMQLRPGLGIGADSAWMVRFLMAIFGWFAVALTGNAQ